MPIPWPTVGRPDLKPDNVLVKIEGPSILERDALDEYENPLPRKTTDDGRVIYLSRNNYGRFLAPVGIVQISDFGFAVSGASPQTGCIQADIYRAPEVVVDAGYTYTADIWSLGVMVSLPFYAQLHAYLLTSRRSVKLWDLLEGKNLFTAKGAGDYDDQIHLAEMAALMGPPPKSLLSRGRRTKMFFHPSGHLKNTDITHQLPNFEESISNLAGEEKAMFIRFAKRMMTWESAD